MAQRELDEAFPAPEVEIGRLSSIAARAPDRRPFVELKRLVVEVDDLVSQARWHAGQALILRCEHPDLINDEQSKDPVMRLSMPTKVELLLRHLLKGSDSLLLLDMADRQLGAPMAGWIFHMMIDDAIYRCIACLDRLARIACIACDVHFDRTYFRGRKMMLLAERVPCRSTESLAHVASSELFELLLKYRDGFSHTRKALSTVSAMPLSDMITGPDGGVQYVENYLWTPSYLLALARGAYQQVTTVLTDICQLCRDRLPGDTVAAVDTQVMGATPANAANRVEG
jgi:hypothetical protein